MFDFDDWGKWGVEDMYCESEKELRNAIESGKPFDTGWHGVTKELQSMKICKDENATIVSVYEYMDGISESWDLFYDFLTDDECEMLTDELIYDIKEDLYTASYGNCFVEEIEYSESLPSDATFEQIIEKAKELIDDCSDRLHDSFLECISITLYYLYMEDPKRDEIIQKRIDEYRYR